MPQGYLPTYQGVSALALPFDARLASASFCAATPLPCKNSPTRCSSPCMPFVSTASAAIGTCAKKSCRRRCCGPCATSPTTIPSRAHNNIFHWLSGLARNEIHRVLGRAKVSLSLETLWANVDKELLAVLDPSRIGTPRRRTAPARRNARPGQRDHVPTAAALPRSAGGQICGPQKRPRSGIAMGLVGKGSRIAIDAGKEGISGDVFGLITKSRHGVVLKADPVGLAAGDAGSAATQRPSRSLDPCRLVRQVKQVSNAPMRLQH